MTQGVARVTEEIPSADAVKTSTVNIYIGQSTRGMPPLPLTLHLPSNLPAKYTKNASMESSAFVAKPFVPAEAGDSRSPCPALNALANHKYQTPRRTRLEIF